MDFSPTPGKFPLVMVSCGFFKIWHGCIILIFLFSQGMERIRSMRHIAFLNTLHNDGFPDVKKLTEEEIENSVHNVSF